MPNNDIDPQELLNSINGVSSKKHSNIDPMELLNSARNNTDDSYWEAIKSGLVGGVGQLMSSTTKSMQALDKPSYKQMQNGNLSKLHLLRTL